MKKYLLFIVFFALLIGMIYAADPQMLWQNLLQMRWMLLVCVGIWGIGYLLNALSFASILGIYPKTRSFGYLETLRVTIAGYAINYVTPLGLLGGEPYRVWELRRYIGLKAATSSVFLYAMMHVCSHFLFWIIGCLLAVFLMPNISWVLGVALVGVSLISVLLIILFFRGYRRGLVTVLVHRLTRMPWVGQRIGKWQSVHARQLSDVDSGISLLLLQHPGRFWFSLCVELLSRMVNVAEIAVLFMQLDLVPEGTLYGASYLVVAFSSLFANLLFFSPLQMGTREGGILLVLLKLLPTFSYAALLPVALSISLATRIREFVWIAIGLLLGIIRKQ